MLAVVWRAGPAVSAVVSGAGPGTALAVACRAASVAVSGAGPDTLLAVASGAGRNSRRGRAAGGAEIGAASSSGAGRGVWPVAGPAGGTGRPTT
ncbi:hypothetical protein [Micromonospora sp. WMMD737]|uniref:hypothetical protein n=1 Tax=Micromonospora sp. WMMD737 TaxID=3404113 RepID=UPI003B95BD23